MAAIKYFCPECGLIVKSGADMSGQSIECLGCKTVFVAQSIQPMSATQVRTQPVAERPPSRSSPDSSVSAPTTPPVQRQSQIQPAPPPSAAVEAKPERPKAAPANEPSRESVCRAPPPPPPPKRPPDPLDARTGASDRPKQRRRDEDDDEIIDLQPARPSKSRLPLVVALIAIGFVMCSGAAGSLWYFVIRDQGLSHKIEAPDKAWAFRLPDAPTASESKGNDNEYAYVRPGKDAEFTVNVNESQESIPDEMIDLSSGLMFMAAAAKYNTEVTAATTPRADATPYDGQYPCRRLEVDSGARGKLTVQMILVKWNANKSTTIIQVAIGKDISDSERRAFFKSVEVKKGAR